MEKKRQPDDGNTVPGDGAGKDDSQADSATELGDVEQVAEVEVDSVGELAADAAEYHGDALR